MACILSLLFIEMPITMYFTLVLYYLVLVTFVLASLPQFFINSTSFPFPIKESQDSKGVTCEIHATSRWQEIVAYSFHVNAQVWNLNVRRPVAAADVMWLLDNMLFCIIYLFIYFSFHNGPESSITLALSYHELYSEWTKHYTICYSNLIMCWYVLFCSAELRVRILFAPIKQRLSSKIVNTSLIWSWC